MKSLFSTDWSNDMIRYVKIQKAVTVVGMDKKGFIQKLLFRTIICLESILDCNQILGKYYFYEKRPMWIWFWYPKYKSKPERNALFGMPKILYPRRLLYSLIVPVLVIDKCAGFNNNKWLLRPIGLMTAIWKRSDFYRYYRPIHSVQ